MGRISSWLRNLLIGHVRERGDSLNLLPRHVAIIMDGNGRWARMRGKPSIFGHHKGADVAYEIVKAASEWGIEVLTLFAFSSENWARPSQEVGGLMDLLKNYLTTQVVKLQKEGIRLRIIGNRNLLDLEIRQMIESAEQQTASGEKMMLLLALSYGGRDEITRACRQLAVAVKEGKILPKEITEGTLESYLDTAGVPEPDLLIRTSGECRLSNFLCWQSSYTELYFSPVLWPDFTRGDFMEALISYEKRERRFGRVAPHAE